MKKVVGGDVGRSSSKILGTGDITKTNWEKEKFITGSSKTPSKFLKEESWPSCSPITVATTQTITPAPTTAQPQQVLQKVRYCNYQPTQVGDVNIERITPIYWCNVDIEGALLIE